MQELIRVDETSIEEARSAYEFLKKYGELGRQPSVRDWSDVEVTQLMPYDDTGGCGLHPNGSGIDATMRIKSPSGQVYEALVPFDEDAHRNEPDGYYANPGYISDKVRPDPNKQTVYLRNAAIRGEGDPSSLDILVESNNLPFIDLSETLPPYVVIKGNEESEIYFLSTKGAKNNAESLDLTGEAIVLDLDFYTVVGESFDDVSGCPEGGEYWSYRLDRRNLGPQNVKSETPSVPEGSSLAKILDDFHVASLRNDQLLKEIGGTEAEFYHHDNMEWATVEYIANELRIPLE